MIDFFRRIRRMLPGWFRTWKMPGPSESVRPGPDPCMDFRRRYHMFRLLLTANNRALEAMADMDALKSASRPFGMSALRKETTAVLVNVFRMVQKLDWLAPGKYTRLFDRFHEIQGELESLLETRPVSEDARLVIPLEKLGKEDADLAGGKMANLGELKNRLGLHVPPGFVVTARAYERFFHDTGLQTEINRMIQAAETGDHRSLDRLCSDIRTLIQNADLPSDLILSLESALADLGAKADSPFFLALRSSAVGEDHAKAAFAGQYKSILHVTPENILGAYKEVVAGKYSLTAVNYRMKRGFRDEDIPMCVGCIAMVDAAASGVIYSSNPFDYHDDSVFIHAIHGLPGPVVDGSAPCDLYVVRPGPNPSVVRQEIRNHPAIEADIIEELAGLTRKMVSHYRVPLDIEWAVTGPGQIVILQCRPLGRRETRLAKPEPKSLGGKPPLAAGGITASPGVGAGPVYRVNTREDLIHFPEGAVLVASHAMAQWAQVLDRAAALITSQGSFAGHLANVAREFGVPALFSLDPGMDLLVPGTLVTVDADNRRVYKGRVPALLSRKSPKPNLMEGSPVHTLLEKMAAKITPLTLLDPDHIDFRPGNCRTLHDITRFVHEKSVKEMFSYGQGIGTRVAGGAKQLYYKVPMQWWILNLDNGFKGEVTGKYVRLDQIASAPMLALWEGMVAFPWEGPPPMNRKGFMSVMFRATANTSLNIGRPTKYANKNYFIISRDYLSFSSRMGFHFTTLESLAGDRPQENYISFRFQGGAADFDRRLGRVRFIGNLLSQYGFEIIIKQDNLQARLRGGDFGHIMDRLRVLGYVIIHTRQLDMVIADPALAGHYGNRFKRDMDTLVT